MVIGIFTIVMWKGMFALSERLSIVEGFVIENSNEKKMKFSSKNIEDDVASGLVKGLQQVREDDENHLKLLEMSRQLQRQPMPVLNQNSGVSETINTGGDLIPVNLSNEEKEVLRMFYEK